MAPFPNPPPENRVIIDEYAHPVTVATPAEFVIRCRPDLEDNLLPENFINRSMPVNKGTKNVSPYRIADRRAKNKAARASRKRNRK